MTHPKQSRRRLYLRILMALCGAGLLASAFLLLSDSREYAKGEASYRQVRQLLRPQPSLPAPGDASIEEVQAELDDGVDLAALQTIHPDVVAWLTAPGTELDYPVVQGRDNTFYLKHLFTGERNKLGSIFLDFRSHGDFSGKNSVVYGHNMKDGSMFSSLTNYKDQGYYDRFPAMELDTPDGRFQIQLFAGLVVDGNYDSVRLEFQDDTDFLAYADSLKEASTFQSPIAVTAEDRMVTLCTCSYEFNNARYALFGILKPA